MQNRIVARAVGAALFIAFTIAATQLSQRDFSYPLEPDIPIGWTKSWMDFLSSGNLDKLTRPYAYVTLDGQPVPAAIAALITRAMFPGYSNDASYVLIGVTAINILSWAGACALFYATVWRATRNIALSILLAVMLFLSPQMLKIHIARADFQITLPLMMVLYVSVITTMGEERLRHAIMLGIAFAFLTTIKISGFLFILLPVLAIATRALPFERSNYTRWGKMLLTSVAVYVVTYAVLMFRFLYHLSLVEMANLYPAGAEIFFSWRLISLYTPRWYYNLDLLVSHGLAFIALYMISAAPLLYFAFKHRDRTAIFALAALAAYSVLGTMMAKYERGGYHLVPLMLLVIALTVTHIARSAWTQRRRQLAIATVLLLLGASGIHSLRAYDHQVAEAKRRDAAIDQIFRPAHRFMEEQMEAGDTICVWKHSVYALPFLTELRAQVSDQLFAFPYLDPEALSHYRPPALETVEKSCDFVVLHDIHIEGMGEAMHRYAPQNQALWDRFIRDLGRKHPPAVFVAAVPVETTARWVGIYKVADWSTRLRCRGGTTSVETVTLSPPFIPAGGDAFAKELPAGEDRGDSLDYGSRSEAKLCEDDHALGPPHALHDAIRSEGGGRFSHWGKQIYLSSSDNSDPNKNGRQYRLLLPLGKQTDPDAQK